jgi:uncharacterized cupin superfamily protein
MPKSIINIDDVELQPRPPQQAPTGAAAEKYDARAGFISPQLGARKLGYNVTAIAPGKRAFPFHNHQVNEEMFLILEGEGEIRIGPDTFPVRRGDIVACPPGGKETAHQFVNTGTTELKFLAVSTKLSPDICDYPDAGTFGVLADMAPENGKPRHFAFVGRESDSGNYWEGA